MARNARTTAEATETVSEVVSQTFADLRRVAQMGLSRLQHEQERITQVLVALDNGHAPEAPEGAINRPKRHITAKQRAETSRRMKKYWAARRKEEKTKG